MTSSVGSRTERRSTEAVLEHEHEDPADGTDRQQVEEHRLSGSTIDRNAASSMTYGDEQHAQREPRKRVVGGVEEVHSLRRCAADHHLRAGREPRCGYEHVPEALHEPLRLVCTELVAAGDDHAREPPARCDVRRTPATRDHVNLGVTCEAIDEPTHGRPRFAPLSITTCVGVTAPEPTPARSRSSPRVDSGARGMPSNEPGESRSPRAGAASASRVATPHAARSPVAARSLVQRLPPPVDGVSTPDDPPSEQREQHRLKRQCASDRHQRYEQTRQPHRAERTGRVRTRAG